MTPQSVAQIHSQTEFNHPLYHIALQYSACVLVIRHEQVPAEDEPRTELTKKGNVAAGAICVWCWSHNVTSNASTYNIMQCMNMHET